VRADTETADTMMFFTLQNTLLHDLANRG